jgi:glycosyltransferase involved in cell wall biosynthesis
MLQAKAMPASSPTISVIVVCRNPGSGLHTTLDSLWCQSHPPELIVIDGASNDGTREWLEARRRRLAMLISEPDRGIYEAMNKGVAGSTSDWVFFLGADDRLAAPSVLAEVHTHLASTDAAVAVGEARFDDGRLYPFAGTDAAIRRNFVHHQAAFYRRSLFDRHGGFDPTLRIQADYEYNLRLLHAGEVFTRLPIRVSECTSGGLSDSGRWANYCEEIIVRHRHFPSAHCLPWDALAMIRYLRKKLVTAHPRHG